MRKNIPMYQSINILLHISM